MWGLMRMSSKGVYIPRHVAVALQARLEQTAPRMDGWAAAGGLMTSAKLAETAKEFSWNGSVRATGTTVSKGGGGGGGERHLNNNQPLPAHVAGMYRAVEAAAAEDMGPNELSKALVGLSMWHDFSPPWVRSLRERKQKWTCRPCAP